MKLAPLSKAPKNVIEAWRISACRAAERMLLEKSNLPLETQEALLKWYPLFLAQEVATATRLHREERQEQDRAVM